MQSSNNIQFGKHLTLVILWLGFVFSAFAYFVGQKLVDFDPQGNLLELETDQLMTSYSQQSGVMLNNVKKTVVHLSASNCSCNQYTKKHQAQIDKQAIDADFTINHLEVADSSLVPSVPAIMVLDEQGELLYLGPYGTGFACSSTSGLVETVLNNFSAGYKSNLIVSQAQGCYCNLPQI